MQKTITIREAANLKPAPGPEQLWTYRIVTRNPEYRTLGTVTEEFLPAVKVRATSHLKAAVGHFPEDARIQTLGAPSPVARSAYEVRAQDGTVLGYVES